MLHAVSCSTVTYDHSLPKPMTYAHCTCCAWIHYW